MPQVLAHLDLAAYCWEDWEPPIGVWANPSRGWFQQRIRVGVAVTTPLIIGGCEGEGCVKLRTVNTLCLQSRTEVSDFVES